jgi:hypothetical protein
MPTQKQRFQPNDIIVSQARAIAQIDVRWIIGRAGYLISNTDIDRGAK